MRTLIALAFGRVIRKLIRIFRHGGGSAVPGTIASKIQPKLFEIAISRFPQGLVVVSGSSGKSTTTKFLVQILENQGLRVFTNPSTANIKQGLFSAVLQGSKGFSLPNADIAVIEMDEAYAKKIGAPLKPKLSILTNVMDEQLDRFEDSQVVQNSLRFLTLASEKVIANGNDPSLAELKAENFQFFGLSNELAKAEASPRYSVSQSSSIENLDYEILETNPLRITSLAGEMNLELKDTGVHMALNFAASIAAADQIVTHLDMEKLEQTANSLQGVYGRDTLEIISGVESRILLVQNHESFRLNLLRAKKATQIFMAIGTDVKDPSWLWGVDMSGLSRVDVLTGHHAIPMKHRLFSCGVEVDKVVTDFDDSLQKFLSFEAPSKGERVFIVTAENFKRMKRSLELSS
jgi:UDP-N-acetylmuramyl tripeptide synthase